MTQKKRMVMLGVLLVLILFLNILVFADTDTGWSCVSDAECFFEGYVDEAFYCGDTGTCMLKSAYENTDDSTSSQTTSSQTNAAATSAQTDLTSLSKELTSTKSEVDSLKSSVASINWQLSEISSSLSELSSSINTIKQQLSQQQQQSLAGQAVLTKDINQTQESIGLVERALNFERSLTTMIIFIVLILAVALSVVIYVNRGKIKAAWIIYQSRRGRNILSKSGTVLGGQTQDFEISKDIIDYITTRIKLGYNYEQISKDLQKAGWDEEQIQSAYAHTSKKNYEEYLKQKSVSPMATSAAIVKRASLDVRTTIGKGMLSKQMDKQKVAIISIFGVLLLIGAIILISGATGKAIFTQKLVGGVEGGSSGVVDYVIECTPPHIPTPDGSACCEDSTTKAEDGTIIGGSNGICDIYERDVSGMENGRCIDNLQCPGNEYCIDNSCALITSLNPGQCSTSRVQGTYNDEVCNYYGVTIRAIYPDGTREKRSLKCSSDSQCNDLIVETTDRCEKEKSVSYCLHTPLVEEYLLKPSQGGYGGAVEWKVLDIPNYCVQIGAAITVPVQLTIKDTGRIVSEEIISLRKGAEVDVPGANFRLKLVTVKEVCGRALGDYEDKQKNRLNFQKERLKG